MTTKEAVRTLKSGTRVCWRENGEIDPEDCGVANQEKGRIEWPDGQITLFCDDWAMAHVEIL